MELFERASHLHVLLVHYPVLNQKGEIITTAVTNLDIHDISRLTRTFGLGSYHIITPVEAQRELIHSVIVHWTKGWGLKHNPMRSDAFGTTVVLSSIKEAIDSITRIEGTRPLLVATSAQFQNIDKMITSEIIRKTENPVALLFGTGWGLAPTVYEEVDALLAPIRGPVEYNHLSVRSAVSIILDRILGNREE
jgi:hypothetical protein